MLHRFRPYSGQTLFSLLKRKFVINLLLSISVYLLLKHLCCSEKFNLRYKEDSNLLVEINLIDENISKGIDKLKHLYLNISRLEYLTIETVSVSFTNFVVSICLLLLTHLLYVIYFIKTVTSLTTLIMTIIKSSSVYMVEDIFSLIYHYKQVVISLLIILLSVLIWFGYYKRQYIKAAVFKLQSIISVSGLAIILSIIYLVIVNSLADNTILLRSNLISIISTSIGLLLWHFKKLDASCAACLYLSNEVCSYIVSTINSVRTDSIKLSLWEYNDSYKLYIRLIRRLIQLFPINSSKYCVLLHGINTFTVFVAGLLLQNNNMVALKLSKIYLVIFGSLISVLTGFKVERRNEFDWCRSFIAKIRSSGLFFVKMLLPATHLSKVSFEKFIILFKLIALWLITGLMFIIVPNFVLAVLELLFVYFVQLYRLNTSLYNENNVKIRENVLYFARLMLSNIIALVIKVMLDINLIDGTKRRVLLVLLMITGLSVKHMLNELHRSKLKYD